MRLSAISFDGDMTLWDFYKVMRHSLTHILHVGDSLEQDVAGAGAAGVHTVWLNREGLTNDTGIKADYEISSLTDLPAILGVG